MCLECDEVLTVDFLDNHVASLTASSLQLRPSWDYVVRISIRAAALLRQNMLRFVWSMNELLCFLVSVLTVTY